MLFSKNMCLMPVCLLSPKKVFTGCSPAGRVVHVPTVLFGVLHAFEENVSRHRERRVELYNCQFISFSSSQTFSFPFPFRTRCNGRFVFYFTAAGRRIRLDFYGPSSPMYLYLKLSNRSRTGKEWWWWKSSK